MASAFAHIAVPALICIAFKSKTVNMRLFALAALLSVIPDADIIAFKFGIPYESPWGHRGFTHSLLFSILIAGLCGFFYKSLRSNAIVVFLVCFAACASHALLDAMTDGGLGVAVYWPFDTQRYFLPWRPIEVSPIGVRAFFTERGLAVIASEFVWVFIPTVLLAGTAILARRLYRMANKR